MVPQLQRESELLARSWERHEASWLRDYLISGVEDPRLNLQSIVTRHFLIRSILGERFSALMQEEYRFCAAMNWLMALKAGADDRAAILHALRRGADNAEGICIPQFVLQTFERLPVSAGSARIANYIEEVLEAAAAGQDAARPNPRVVETFSAIWSSTLSDIQPEHRPGILEPACGSANDYRCLEACGLARLVDYTGLDLSRKNIDNARNLFPAVRFEVGNVFELHAPNKSFDFCLVQDLFEHLSPAGLEAAVHQICRVTRHGICAGFFQMDEIAEHLVRPVEDYYWNRLSMRRTTELFASQGFTAQVLHMGTFLREQTGCQQTHNPYAYTFVLRAD